MAPASLPGRQVLRAPRLAGKCELPGQDTQKPSTSCPRPKIPPGGGKKKAPPAQAPPRKWQRDLEQCLSSAYVPVVLGPRGAKVEPPRFTFYIPQYSNSLSPFYTLQKPTCGYLYSRTVDHTRKRLDMPPANRAMWQS